MSSTNPIELSLVIPCLNEEDTLENCLVKANESLQKSLLTTEIIVADNGSTDRSREIALRNGARVVTIEEAGYGNALMGGISASGAKWVIIGDADENHDFAELPKFIAKLEEGYDLVQGCRFPSGGGNIKQGSMSFLHRRFGNPFFSLLVRNWFDMDIHDVYCGFRGFTSELYEKLDQRCTGMEFAPEMIIKAGLLNANIAEVPITHHPDGRKTHASHMHTFRDGWRTMRFFLMYSPRWLFLFPGFILFTLGLVFFGLGFTLFSGYDQSFLVQNFIIATLFIMCGYQSILFAVFTKVFAINENLFPKDERLDRFFEVVNLERGLIVSFISLLTGLILLGFGVFSFDVLELTRTHFLFSGAALIALGFQTILFGFFVSILGLKRK
ncbi:MAG: glycosyltransferase family 2 protein [Acidobacteria bacterium]|nr:glycosyltransferase family 2 protein [Acidobacteriota bacterium]